MKPLYPPKKRLLLLVIIILSIGNYIYSQEKRSNKNRLQKTATESFQLRTEFAIKGDMTFIANNTLNRSGVGGGASVNNAFNRRGNNDNNGNMYMNYIDVDSDPTTFSSSSATLSIPSCSKVTYAGLYWAAIYPYQHWDDQEIDGEAAPLTRDDDFNLIKFKLPGASDYTNITGNILYDAGAPNQKPYVCYKDVTDLLQGLSNPNGEYWGANIKATKGKDIHGDVLGSSAGWVLVVIYENATETRKKFFIYDGFKTITEQAGGAAGVYDIDFSGFTTIPTGQVGANILLGALEGDINLDDDTFQIKDTGGNFQLLSTPNINDADNFFNSTITFNDNFLGGRTPDSENTLGFEVDFFQLNNVNNTLLGNNQSNGTVRFSSQGDTYWPFLLGLSVEVIEPDVELVKSVDDGIGNDIAGDDVNLGDVIWYDISFRNRGNDDATGTVLTDRLPKNVDLVESDIIVPDGVTYTYEPPSLANEYRGVLTFTIPDSMVEVGGPEYHIRFKVQVVSNCNELRDVCSNKIENQALISYTGITSGVVVNDEPSFYGLDDCNFGYAGAVNFLADVSGCTYEREEVLCAASLDLTAGAGFVSYEWTNGNGDVIGNTQTITVTETGTYTVVKTASPEAGCLTTTEVINVIEFSVQENPILSFADEIKTCANDGSKLSEIYLCGEGSARLLEVNMYNSNTIIWEKLDETSCITSTDPNCPTTDNSCTWNQVGTGTDFTADTAGQYRVEIRAQGGCFKRFYFNVFEATLNPNVVTNDIICGTAGNITINNVPNGYEYSLTNTDGSYQDSNTFNISTAGNYNIYIRRKNAAATACVYTLPQVTIFEREIEVDLITEPILCSDSTGAIRIQVNNVPGDYTYKLSKGGNLLATAGPKSENDHSFVVSEAGTYTVEVTTPDNCSFTGDVTFTKPDPLIFTATNIKDITCTDGIIELNASGGTPSYNYAIWSYNGVDLYASVNDIPFSKYFTSATVNIPEGEEGIYEFLVIDSNNCWTISSPVTINLEPDLAFIDTANNVACNGESNGSFEITVDGSDLGYSIEYSIDGGTNYQSSGIFNNLTAGTYNIDIKASKGGDVCTYSHSVTITEPTILSGAANLTQEYTCTTDGIITFDNPTGGTAPYKFSIDGVNYFTTKVFNNLTDGTYSISVKDTNNCVLNLADITIDALPVTPNFVADVTYNCDGTGNVSITPTNPSYTYSLDGGAFSSTSTFNNLAVGIHTIDVSYGKNCVETLNVNIESNQAFGGIITEATNVTCNGSDNGTLTISAENYNGSYEYSIDGGTTWATTNTSPITISNLSPGTYGVQIRYSTCTLVLGDRTITEPDVLTVSATITTVISCTNSGATIMPEATGGTAPYQFSIDGGATWVSQFTNVLSGSYSIIARDSNNCITAVPFNIDVDDPLPLTHTATSTQCYDGTNGEIVVNVTQGNGNYVFSINNGPWLTPNNATPTQYAFTNLSPNTYTIKVKDALECESSESTHTIYPILNASVTTKDISCFPGEITVNTSGGDGNYVYAIIASGSNPNADFSASNSKQITSTGNYDVYVRDHSGGAGYCEFVKTVTIDQIPDLTLNVTPTNPTCFGETGELTVGLSGGTAPYSIAITGPSAYSNTTNSFYGTSKDYYNLEAGAYTITITDVNGCSENTTATIVEPTELTATINPIIPADCNDLDPNHFGFEFVVDTSIYAPYTVQFSDDNGTTWSASNTFMGYDPGTKVYPAIRMLELDGVTTRCIKYFDEYTIPFHVTSLIFSVTPGGSCADGFSVTLEADGVGPFQFAINSITDWKTPTPVNSNTYVFDGLTPGLDYSFYVKDATGCIQQNNDNIYESFASDIIIGTVTQEACPTLDNGEITFTINDPTNQLSGTINWGLYNRATNVLVRDGSQPDKSDIIVSNLPTGDYYLTIENGACSWGSADVTITKGTEITGILAVANHITCDTPGVIQINNLSGGFGSYEFTLTSPNFMNPIVSTHTSIEIPISNLVDPTVTSAVTVHVSDLWSCEKSLGSIDIDVSEKPVIDSVTTDNCTTNKTITVAGAGGSAPYLYSIDGGTSYQTASLFENLSPATYTVMIKDSNGCLSNPQDLEIFPSLDFNALVTKSLDCTVSPEAQVQINITSGSGNYDFEIKDSSNNVVSARANLSTNPKTISFSTADTYSITVYDNDANCSKTITVEIVDEILPDFTYIVDDSTCSGSDSGTISLTNSSSAITYTYSISPAVTYDANSNSYINVAPGTYEITATGSNGCSVVKSNIIIQEFDPIVVPAPTVTEFGCSIGNTTDNAVISVNTAAITGGSGTHTIIEFVNNQGTADTADDVIVQSGTASTYVTNDKNGGNFTINIYDDSNCSGSVNAVINPFAELLSTAIIVDKAIDCATGEDITVSYTSSLPIGNIQFEINGQKGYSSTNTTGIFTNLAEDNYTINVTNVDTGCVLETTHQVNNPNQFELVVTKLNDVSCFGSSTGDISLSFSATTPYADVYNYVVYNNATNTPTTIIGSGTGTTTISNLPQGEYYVLVSMPNTPFCDVTSPIFTIENPVNPLSISVSETLISCESPTSGAFSIAATGGWGEYQYKVETTLGTIIQNYSTNSTVSNLGAESYIVTVKDKNDCEVSTNITLSNPTPIIGTVTEITSIECFGDAGATIEVNGVSGGQGSPPTYWYQLQRQGQSASAKQTSNTFSGLTAGDYSVIISDGYSCSISLPIIITEPPKVEVTAAITSTVSCLVGTANVEVNAFGGIGPYTYSSDGINFEANNVFAMVPGIYQFYAKDSKGCVSEASTNITINSVPPLTAVLNIDSSLISCASDNTAVISAIVSGGLGNYKYELLDGSDVVIRPQQTSAIFSNLGAGTYKIRVTSEDCVTVTNAHTITEPSPLQLTAPIQVTDISCFGSDNGQISINAIGGTGKLTYSIDQIKFVKTNVFENLAEGDYDIIVQDANGCFITETVTVQEPNELIVEAINIKDETCFGNSDGSFDIQITGGTAPYKTKLGAGAFVENQLSFTNLDGGKTHVVFVEDSNGCETLVIVPLKLGVDLNFTTITETSCSNYLGKITASVDATYTNEVTYRLNGGTPQNSGVFANLADGTYTVEVTHTDGCVITKDVVVANPSPLTFSAPTDQTNVSCNGGNNGTFTIHAQGGQGQLSYSLDGTNFQSSNVFTNLAAGNYTATVKDELNCPITTSVTITEPTILGLIIQNKVDETCFGNANGSFDIQITGGTGPYQTKIDNQVYVQGQLNFSGLEGGKIYTVYVKDANNCETSTTVTIDVGVQLNFSTEVQVNCTNYLSKITASVDAAYTNEVTYRLNGGASQTSGIFDNLADGTYTIEVTHTDGCVITKDVVIANPSPLTFSAPTDQTDVSCNGGNNGAFTIHAQGGQGSLLYSIDGVNFQSSNVFTGLVAGSYQVTVKDELNCPITTSVTITEPTILGLIIQNKVDETCFGNANGSFDIQITGGTGPYQTKIDNQVYVQGQLNFSGLEGGKIYTVYVEDSQGCQTSIEVPLAYGVDLNFTTRTETNCTNYLGRIVASVDGAYANEVTYRLNGGAIQTLGVFDNLADGTYTIEVIHANGCIVTNNVVISNPIPPTFSSPATVTNVLCNGSNQGAITVHTQGGQGSLSYSIDGVNFQSSNIFTGLTAGNYQVTVKDETGCNPILQNIIITEPTELNVSITTIEEEICFGDANGAFEISVTGGTAPYKTRLINNQQYVEGQFRFENLQGGNSYSVSVVDANGCEKIVAATLAPSTALELTLNSEYTCSNGSKIIAGINDPYKDEVVYILDELAPQKEGVFNNLEAGTYTVTAVHNNGCSTSKEITIDYVEPLSFSVDTGTVNTFIVNAEGGFAPYTYSIGDKGFVSNGEFLFNVTRTYVITVKDSMGCEVSQEIEGTFVTIEIPNFFTPNGNGENDYWYPKKVQDYHNIKVQIYDRYSRLLKTLYGKQIGWDGVYNNTPLPSGDYWYVIEYTEILGEKKKLIGNFTLYR